MARNRVIYQSQALFIAPSSTGYHMQTGLKNENRSVDAVGNTNWTGVTGITTADGAGGIGHPSTELVLNRSLLEPLHRVQSANFNFIN